VRRLTAFAGEAYVALCAVLALLAFVPPTPNAWAFYGLFLVMLPISALAYAVQWVGGTLLFGSEPGGLLLRVAIAVGWLALAVAQMIAVRAVIRATRGRRTRGRRTRGRS
jgi:hypothetical protein